MSKPHWHVLGAGAMGCLFASALQRAGCSVTLLLRRRDSDTVTVTVDSDGDTCCAAMQTSIASDPEPIEHLLVTTKAYDVYRALVPLGHRLHADSQVLVMVNGLGYASEIEAALPAPQFFYGTTTEGAYAVGERHIHHAGRGQTRVGQAGRRVAPPWFTHWSRAVQPGSWDPDIDQALWLKLAINCAINPLSALHRCRNGALAAPVLAAEVAQLCSEIVQVGRAAGFELPDLQTRVAQVIAGTADNRSSMLQDVLAGRPTEIEFITGYLLRLAALHGIATPHNEALYRKLTDCGA